MIKIPKIAMKQGYVLRGIGVIGLLAFAIFNGLETESLIALLIMPLFFIGNPWYKFFRK